MTPEPPLRTQSPDAAGTTGTAPAPGHEGRGATASGLSRAPPRRCWLAGSPAGSPTWRSPRSPEHAPAGAGPGPSRGVLRVPGGGAGLVKSRGSSPPRRSPGEASGAASGVPRREPSRSALLGGAAEACAGGAGPASACSPRRSTPSPGTTGSCGDAGLVASNAEVCSGALAAGPGVSSSAVSLLSAESAAASSSDGSLSPPSSAGADGISWTKLLSRTVSESLSSERKGHAEAAGWQGTVSGPGPASPQPPAPTVPVQRVQEVVGVRAAAGLRGLWLRGLCVGRPCLGVVLSGGARLPGQLRLPCQGDGVSGHV